MKMLQVQNIKKDNFPCSPPPSLSARITFVYILNEIAKGEAQAEPTIKRF